MIGKIKDYFSFNKKERNGILLLSFILFFLILFYQFSYLLKTDAKTDFSDFEKALSELEYANDSPQLKEKKSLFIFNPNTLNDDGWLALGLSEGKLKVLRNYQKSGGYFKKKEDLQRCYAFGDAFYNIIKEYVSIPEIDEPEPKSQQPITTTQIIELNQADSLDLISVKGIGSFYAKQILKYRNELGGFYSFSQFSEIWGLEKLDVEKIKLLTTIDTLLISNININTATIEKLRNHPYLNYKQAKMIVNYREQHGNYHQLKDICEIKPISLELFRKIAPYFQTHD
ncbi:MAG TPA: helix-hairpin-helix domain-containing protein [Flavobacteriales bacterium]|nr:helix-hairpin-helix domain-containing protein [Flavobacteriales bacterium]